MWNNIAKLLSQDEKLCLMYVIDSDGSSPGRRGFSMFVTEKGFMGGSIGGGFMEQKLVELAKAQLTSGDHKPFFKRQIHRADAVKDKSGMICSGEQTIAFYFLKKEDLHLIERITAGSGVLELNEKGIVVLEFEELYEQNKIELIDDDRWRYLEKLNYRNEVYIIGGGHVGLALSRVMHQLGFYVEVIDDRQDLFTMKENEYAHRKHILSYDEVDNYIPEGGNVYVVLVSFGFRTDEEILRRLLGKHYRYIGMMGSKEKVRLLFDKLINEGYREEYLKKVHSPIGIQINSKSPEEIAVSIAAEIIKVKNG